MRFNGFNFYCNPLSIEVTSENNSADYSLIYKGQQKEYTGKRCRTVKGEGVISGKDCLEQYAKLYALQAQGGKGILSLPTTRPFEAMFLKLTVLADPTPDTISYSFQFAETNSGVDNKKNVIHKVRDGETLFDIAHIYGVQVDALLELNPQIRRFDELTEYEEIKIC